MMQKILDSLLPQILSRYPREDGKRAEPETTTPTEEISAQKKGKKQKEKKKSIKNDPLTKNQSITVNEL